MSEKRIALLSVFDKTGIVPFAKSLCDLGFCLVSSGGTARTLRESGLNVQDVSDFTGAPEIFQGRVKTLHPKVHGGILARRGNDDDLKTMKELDIAPIDLVVVNLYPFEATIKKEGVEWQEIVENIDIGGPTMIRSAAKNYKDVLPVVNPEDYDQVLSLFEKYDRIPEDEAFVFATKAFCHTAYYDGVICNHFWKKAGEGLFPEEFAVPMSKNMSLRYGENPHQQAALYEDKSEQRPIVSAASQLWGKELSFNNLNDADGTLKLCLSYQEPAVVISKHNNPCGLAIGSTIAEAYQRALSCDPVSAFGSIVAVNRTVDAKAAELMSKLYIEVLMAPAFDPDALEILKKKKNIRLLALENMQAFGNSMDWKKVSGGFLCQDSDRQMVKLEDLKVVTKAQPSEADLRGLLFAWKAVKYVKSNAILFANHTQTLGIGAGQMSRVDSVKLAVMKTQFDLKDSFLASDAFFPFRDGVDAAAEVGVKAIIQPGGSVRDQEVIDACNEHGIAMVFTDMRHFRH